MQTLQTIILWTVVVGISVALLILSANRDSVALSTNYCWDANGNHYVAPNSACTGVLN